MVKITNLLQKNSKSNQAKSRLRRSLKLVNILPVIIIITFIFMVGIIAYIFFAPEDESAENTEHISNNEAFTTFNSENQEDLSHLESELEELDQDSTSSSPLSDRVSPPAEIDNDLEATSSPSITKTPKYILDNNYYDEKFGYKVFYNDRWEFRKTYGEDIEKMTETDVVSGFDLHRYYGDEAVGNVGINLLDAHNLTDIDQWMEQYDDEEPAEEKQIIEYSQVQANYYSYQNSPEMKNYALYFIKNNYVFRIWWWGKTIQGLNEATAIVESFVIEDPQQN